MSVCPKGFLFVHVVLITFVAYQQVLRWVLGTPTQKEMLITFFKVKIPEGTKMIVQDRAYTSPIWYTPGN